MFRRTPICQKSIRDSCPCVYYRRLIGHDSYLILELYHFIILVVCVLLTLLVVPLALHLLDDAEVEHGVPALAAAVQRRQEVRHDALVPRLAGAGQARQVLQDQLLPVLGESLKYICSNV